MGGVWVWPISGSTHRHNEVSTTPFVSPKGIFGRKNSPQHGHNVLTFFQTCTLLAWMFSSADRYAKHILLGKQLLPSKQCSFSRVYVATATKKANPSFGLENDLVKKYKIPFTLIFSSNRNMEWDQGTFLDDIRSQLMRNYSTLDLLPTFEACRDLVVRFIIVVEAIYSLFDDTNEMDLLFSKSLLLMELLLSKKENRTPNFKPELGDLEALAPLLEFEAEENGTLQDEKGFLEDGISWAGSDISIRTLILVLLVNKYGLMMLRFQGACLSTLSREAANKVISIEGMEKAMLTHWSFNTYPQGAMCLLDFGRWSSVQQFSIEWETSSKDLSLWFGIRATLNYEDLCHTPEVTAGILTAVSPLPLAIIAILIIISFLWPLLLEFYCDSLLSSRNIDTVSAIFSSLTLIALAPLFFKTSMSVDLPWQMVLSGRMPVLQLDNKKYCQACTVFLLKSSSVMDTAVGGKNASWYKAQPGYLKLHRPFKSYELARLGYSVVAYKRIQRSAVFDLRTGSIRIGSTDETGLCHLTHSIDKIPYGLWPSLPGETVVN